jgi:hypothetical protein
MRRVVIATHVGELVIRDIVCEPIDEHSAIFVEFDDGTRECGTLEYRYLYGDQMPGLLTQDGRWKMLLSGDKIWV